MTLTWLQWLPWLQAEDYLVSSGTASSEAVDEAQFSVVELPLRPLSENQLLCTILLWR